MNVANDEIFFAGAVTTLNLTTTLDNEDIDWDSNNILSTDNAGGTAVDLIDFGAVTKANYTHTGTGALTWDGQNLTGNQVIKANAVQGTADTITGGAGNDNLTGDGATVLLVVLLTIHCRDSVVMTPFCWWGNDN